MSTSSTNMSLTLWSSLADPYDSSQLVANWNIIDIHDHSGSGKGINIPAAGLASNSVTTAKILDGNVTTAKIADSTGSSDGIIATKLATYSVITAKILDNNVKTAKVAILPAARLTSVTTTGQSLTTATETNVLLNSTALDTGVASGDTAMANVTGLTVTTTAASTAATLSATTGLVINTTYTISSSGIPAANNITFTTGGSLSTSITLSSGTGVTAATTATATIGDSRIYIRRTGVYTVSAYLTFAAQTTFAGYRQLTLYRNSAGTVTKIAQNIVSGTTGLNSVIVPVSVSAAAVSATAGDYFYIGVYQTSAGALLLGTADQPSLRVNWVGKAA